MFDSDSIDKSLYSEKMKQIKQANADQMRDAQRRHNISKLRLYVREGRFRKITAAVRGYSRQKASQRNLKIKSRSNQSSQSSTPNYFSDEKIAVYTVITGDYDKVLEPYCRPDNIDYFLFTDRDFDDSLSAWERMDIPSCPEGLSDAEKNRYLKMHPHELFRDYNYSIYVDGNIQIITDLTEYINMLGPTGIGIHLHPYRHCAYEELNFVVASGIVTPECAQRQVRYMEETGMPHNYGLLECCMIAREHHNRTCTRIMEQWWQEYMEYTKRDQISLPHVLYENGIPVEEVGALGVNVRANPSFRFVKHNASRS